MKKYFIMRRYLCGMAGEKCTDWEKLRGYLTREDAERHCPEDYSLEGDDQYIVQEFDCND